MLPSKDGVFHPISTGCLIIAPTRYNSKNQVQKSGWDQFVNQIGNIDKFKLILQRR